MAIKSDMPTAIYVDTLTAFQEMIAQIKRAKQLAVDTESNNMYAYHGQVCLIQLSTRTQDYIVDPLALDDIQALGDLFADETVEKIFHAAEYDLICMKRDFDFTVNNLFDTMAAARLTGAEQFGLGDLLLQHFGVAVDKSHQRDNWGKRPLSQASLTYAQMDTHYLHELRDNLYQSLEELGRLDEAQEIFKDVLRIEVKERQFDPNGFWKIGKPRRLSRRQMAVLKELYILRERLAEKEDQPPFKMLSNKALINLVRQLPASHQSLDRIKGLNYKIAQTYRDDIIEAIKIGKSNQAPKQPRREEPDPIISERYVGLHAWRKNVARARKLDSSLIITKQTLWDLAYTMPQTLDDLAQIDGFGEWRLQEYGEDLLDVIAKLH